MRVAIVAAIAALGLTAACTERNDDVDGEETVVTTEYGASADQAALNAAAEANAAANAAEASAAQAAAEVDGDTVTFEAGPDGARVSGTVESN